MIEKYLRMIQVKIELIKRILLLLKINIINMILMLIQLLIYLNKKKLRLLLN